MRYKASGFELTNRFKFLKGQAAYPLANATVWVEGVDFRFLFLGFPTLIFSLLLELSTPGLFLLEG